MAKNDDLLDLLNEIKLRYQIDQQEVLGLADDDNVTTAINSNISPEKINFMLALRLREVTAVENFLQGILAKKSSERQLWLTQNQTYLERFNQLIAQNSHWSLIGLKSGQKNSALSLSLAQEIKNAVTLMNSLFDQETDLHG